MPLEPQAPHQRRRRPWREVIQEASEKTEETVVTVKDDGTIPLATIGDTERRLAPVITPENMQVPNQDVADALNRGLATRQMDARVNTSNEAAEARKMLVWRYWVQEERKRSTWPSYSSTATCDYIWDSWIKSSTSTSTATTTDIWWTSWVDQEARGIYKHAKAIRRVPPPPPTPEELARQQAIRDAEEAARKARVAALEYAKEKAEKLLLSVLNPQQKEELKTKGYFHCKSQKGFVYRIYKGTHGNVKRLDERGKEVESLCIQPDNVPVHDAMLAQKLHIELNEEEFRKTANITRLMN